MLQRTAYKFRAYPDPEQESLFWRTAGCCRLVYNLCLEQRRLEWHRSVPRRITAAGQMKELKALKAAAPFLREVPHHPLQQAIRDLDRAFQNFFEGRAAYPKPRTKFRHTSFPLSRSAADQGGSGWGEDLPAKGRWVPVRMHREIIGDVKNVTVSESGGWWFVSIAVEQEIEEPTPRTGSTVGIDLGVVNAIATSDGNVFDLPRVGSQEQQQLAAVQKTIARRKKGSRNRFKAILKLRRIQARHARRRADAKHKATSRLVQDHAVIVMEDLKVRNMTKSAKNNRGARLQGRAEGWTQSVASRHGAGRDPATDRVQDATYRRSDDRRSHTIHLAAVFLLRVDDPGKPIITRSVLLCLLRLRRLRRRERCAEHIGQGSHDPWQNRRTSGVGLWIELRWKPEAGNQARKGQKPAPSGAGVVTALQGSLCGRCCRHHDAARNHRCSVSP